MKLSSICLLTLTYLALPLVVFFVGWLKPTLATVAVLPVLFCGWHLVRCWPADSPTATWRDLFLLAAFSFALTAFAGIGGFAPQYSDWMKHNAILYDCVNLTWPVILADGSDRWALVYYLAYYLPAAVVGKIAGYGAAQVALWIWSSLGVMLSCFWFARLTRLPAALAALAFFAFSGLDLLANIFAHLSGLSEFHSPMDIYHQSWARIWQFPANFWALQWSPGQALAAWLSAGLFIASPLAMRSVSFVFLLTCNLLWSPISGIGLSLLFFFLVRRDSFATVAKPLVPMIPLALPFSLLMVFYAAKLAPDVKDQFKEIPIGWFNQFHAAPTPFKSVALLLMFVVFEFGIYVWFIRRRFPAGTIERKLVEACGLTLFCLLPITVGYYSDLSLRASAVPLFGIAVLTVRTLTTAGVTPKVRGWFWFFVLAGSLTPLGEVCQQVNQIANRNYDSRVVPHQVSAVVNMADRSFGFFGAQYVGTTNSFFSQNLTR